MLEITINGEIHNIASGQNLAVLLQNLELDPTKVAIERNLEIVPKTTYQHVMLGQGDKLEIVYFIGGG